jgi:cell division protein FtsL
MARAAARKKRTPIGSRTLVALGLVSLLSVAALVVWRRAIAVAENREVRSLEEKKRELISLRTTLERDLVEATSRQRIVPAAEKRLGMHVATELEVRNLPSQAMRESALRDSAIRDTVIRDTVIRDTLATDTLTYDAVWHR